MHKISKPIYAFSRSGRKFHIGLDHGTQSTKICLMSSKAEVLFVQSKEHKIQSPQESFLQINPEEVTHNIRELFTQLKTHVQNTECCKLEEIESLGLTNQRESVVLWDSETGEPLTEIILWSDNRTKEICQSLVLKYGGREVFKDRTGLPISTFFTLFKILWALEHVPAVQKANERGRLRVSTMDSWILGKLTNESHHVTDHTNASRTFMYNINKLDWDLDILKEFRLNREILPELKDSCDDFGTLKVEELEHVKINTVLGDQQAAAFGVGCIESRDWNVTFGTSTVMIKPTGSSPKFLPNFLTSLLFHDKKQTIFGIEGLVETGGISLNFFQNQLNILKNVAEMSKKTTNLPIEEMLHDKFFIGTFNGIFAPVWNSGMRSMLVGLSQSDDPVSIFSAVLEGVAFRMVDQLLCAPDEELNASRLIFNGGLSKSHYLRRFCAQLLQKNIESSTFADSTVLGVTLLSSLYKPGHAINFSKMQKLLPPREATLPEAIPQVSSALKVKYERYKLLRDFGAQFFEPQNH